MSPRELAEALRAEILPGSAVEGRLLAAGEYSAVVLDTIEYAANHHSTVRPELLAAVQSALDSGALDDGAFDADDAESLRADLAALPVAAL